MWFYFFIIIAILFSSCKSFDIPTIEQSERMINQYSNNLQMAERAINARKSQMPEGRDLILISRLEAMNKLMTNLAKHRTDDVIINFHKTPNFFSEKKSVLGINYTNSLQIDTGIVTMDLKKFSLDKINRNLISGFIEIEGNGNIKASGVYTGIKANASPDIDIYLAEQLSFDISPSMTGQIVISPNPKKLNLKTKFNIKLLEWKLPINREIQFELTDLLKPLVIPLMFDADMILPMPDEKAQKNQLSQENFKLIFLKPEINANNNRIEYRADVELKKATK